MRTLSFWLTALLTLGLVGALPASVSATAEPQVASATFVTGRLIDVTYVEAAEAAEAGEASDDIDQVRGLVQVQRVAWSDPRLPSRKRTVTNIDGYLLESHEGVLPFTGTHRLDGLTGSWTGTQSGVLHADGCFWQDILIGEGAYRGLTAVLKGRMVFDASGQGLTLWEGYIFEGDLPPAPAAVPPGNLDTSLEQRCLRCA